MPVVDGLAAEYGDRVDFVAPAGKSTFDLTKARAEELFRSGKILWGLDGDEEIFTLYAIPYQPVTVLIAADRTVVESWAGIRPEEDIRTALEDVLDVSG